MSGQPLPAHHLLVRSEARVRDVSPALARVGASSDEDITRQQLPRARRDDDGCLRAAHGMYGNRNADSPEVKGPQSKGRNRNPRAASSTADVHCASNPRPVPIHLPPIPQPTWRRSNAAAVRAHARSRHPPVELFPIVPYCLVKAARPGLTRPLDRDQEPSLDACRNTCLPVVAAFRL